MHMHMQMQPYGQPPAYGQPSYGQPYGQPPAYGQPSYGQPAYGQPAYGASPYMQNNAMMAPAQQVYSQPGVRLFQQLDGRGSIRDGVLAWTEFAPLCQQIGWDVNTAQMLWYQTDTDRSGTLSQHEFLQFCARPDVLPYVTPLENTVCVAVGYAQPMMQPMVQPMMVVPMHQQTYQQQSGGWKKIGDENHTVTVPAGSRVRYGARGKWVERVMSGTFKANNSTFGDPIPGVVKVIEILDIMVSISTTNTTPYGNGTSQTTIVTGGNAYGHGNKVRCYKCNGSGMKYVAPMKELKNMFSLKHMLGKPKKRCKKCQGTGYSYH